jgi:hypothetical protein
MELRKKEYFLTDKGRARGAEQPPPAVLTESMTPSTQVAAENGSFLAEKPRISWATPDFNKGAKPSSLSYDLNGLCEALGNLGPPRAAEGHRRRHARGIAT